MGTSPCRWTAWIEAVRRLTSVRVVQVAITLSTNRSSLCKKEELLVVTKAAITRSSRKSAKRSRLSGTLNAKRLLKSSLTSCSTPNSTLIQPRSPTKPCKGTKLSPLSALRYRTRCARCAIQTSNGP